MAAGSANAGARRRKWAASSGTGARGANRRMTATPRLYARHACAADRGRWSVERSIRWGDIDRACALVNPRLLESLRDAALIEAYHPVHLQRLLAATWDDVDAGVVFSLELFEGFK